jgi:hypothetical protein
LNCHAFVLIFIFIKCVCFRSFGTSANNTNVSVHLGIALFLFSS